MTDLKVLSSTDRDSATNFFSPVQLISNIFICFYMIIHETPSFAHGFRKSVLLSFQMLGDLSVTDFQFDPITIICFENVLRFALWPRTCPVSILLLFVGVSYKYQQDPTGGWCFLSSYITLFISCLGRKGRREREGRGRKEKEKQTCWQDWFPVASLLGLQMAVLMALTWPSSVHLSVV